MCVYIYIYIYIVDGHIEAPPNSEYVPQACRLFGRPLKDPKQLISGC